MRASHDALVGAVVPEVASWADQYTGPSGVIAVIAVSTLQDTQVEGRISIGVGRAVLDTGAGRVQAVHLRDRCTNTGACSGYVVSKQWRTATRLTAPRCCVCESVGGNIAMLDASSFCRVRK